VSPTSMPTIIVVVPQTEAAAIQAIKSVDKIPSLRLVLALPSRFHRLAKDPLIAPIFYRLVDAGRLELAIQISNPPLLPLLIDTDEAKRTLPPGTDLPIPAYRHPEDVTQIVARTRADFFKSFSRAPKGIVLPYGAVSTSLLELLQRLNMAWVVAQYGLAEKAGVYKRKGLILIDGRINDMVFDERVQPEAMKRFGELTRRLQSSVPSAQKPEDSHKSNNNSELLTLNSGLSLPSDPQISVQEIDRDRVLGGVAWTSSDWSRWIGSSQKNAAWRWLEKTRDDLDHFKNSGKASIQRLDMAFDELMTAQSASFFAAIGDSSKPELSQEREQEFKATLSSVYRLMSENPPDNLFAVDNGPMQPTVRASSTTVSWVPSSLGGLLTFHDASGDDVSKGLYDFQQMQLVVSSQSLDWTLTFAALPPPTAHIDLYIDLNGQPHLGTIPLLSGHDLEASSSDAWEYAISIIGTDLKLYRTKDETHFEFDSNYPLMTAGNRMSFQLPRSSLRGNPQRWGYQIIVTDAQQAVQDLLDPIDITQADLLKAIQSGERKDIPFVRVK